MVNTKKENKRKVMMKNIHFINLKNTNKEMFKCQICLDDWLSCGKNECHICRCKINSNKVKHLNKMI
jgi:hypothetical protein